MLSGANLLSNFQALFCEIEAVALGHRSKAWGRRRSQNFNQPKKIQTANEYSRVFYCPVSRRSEKVYLKWISSFLYIFIFSHRAWFYCKACHEDVKDENLIKKCKCKHCKSNYGLYYDKEKEKNVNSAFLTKLHKFKKKMNWYFKKDLWWWYFLFTLIVII